MPRIKISPDDRIAQKLRAEHERLERERLRAEKKAAKERFRKAARTERKVNALLTQAALLGTADVDSLATQWEGEVLNYQTSLARLREANSAQPRQTRKRRAA